jgi:hypothetical protein
LSTTSISILECTKLPNDDAANIYTCQTEAGLAQYSDQAGLTKRHKMKTLDNVNIDGLVKSKELITAQRSRRDKASHNVQHVYS